MRAPSENVSDAARSRLPSAVTVVNDLYSSRRFSNGYASKRPCTTVLPIGIGIVFNK